MDYEHISKDTVGAIYRAHSSLKKSPLGITIICLVELRVSQINGCEYCCKLHTTEATEHGVPKEKIADLPQWNTSQHFNEEEKAALELAEVLTTSPIKGKEIIAEINHLFDERQLIDLTLCVSLMNALNRIAISLRDH